MPTDKSYQTFLRTRHLSALCNNHSSCALGGPSGDLPETRLSAFRHILKPLVAFINGFVFRICRFELGWHCLILLTAPSASGLISSQDPLIKPCVQLFLLLEVWEGCYPAEA